MIVGPVGQGGCIGQPARAAYEYISGSGTRINSGTQIELLGQKSINKVSGPFVLCPLAQFWKHSGAWHA